MLHLCVFVFDVLWCIAGFWKQSYRRWIWFAD